MTPEQRDAIRLRFQSDPEFRSALLAKAQERGHDVAALDQKFPLFEPVKLDQQNAGAQPSQQNRLASLVSQSNNPILSPDFVPSSRAQQDSLVAAYNDAQQAKNTAAMGGSRPFSFGGGKSRPLNLGNDQAPVPQDYSVRENRSGVPLFVPHDQPLPSGSYDNPDPRLIPNLLERYAPGPEPLFNPAPKSGQYGFNLSPEERARLGLNELGPERDYGKVGRLEAFANAMQTGATGAQVNDPSVVARYPLQEKIGNLAGFVGTMEAVPAGAGIPAQAARFALTDLIQAAARKGMGSEETPLQIAEGAAKQGLFGAALGTAGKVGEMLPIQNPIAKAIAGKGIESAALVGSGYGMRKIEGQPYSSGDFAFDALLPVAMAIPAFSASVARRLSARGVPISELSNLSKAEFESHPEVKAAVEQTLADPMVQERLASSPEHQATMNRLAEQIDAAKPSYSQDIKPNLVEMARSRNPEPQGPEFVGQTMKRTELAEVPSPSASDQRFADILAEGSNIEYPPMSKEEFAQGRPVSETNGIMVAYNGEVHGKNGLEPRYDVYDPKNQHPIHGGTVSKAELDRAGLKAPEVAAPVVPDARKAFRGGVRPFEQYENGSIIPVEFYDGLRSTSGGTIHVKRVGNDKYTVVNRINNTDVPLATNADEMMARDQAERAFGKDLRTDYANLYPAHRKALEETLRTNGSAYKGWEKDYPDLAKNVPTESSRPAAPVEKAGENRQVGLRTALAQRKVTRMGNRLADALDLNRELKARGAEVDNEGYVTLYHRTTPEAADAIVKSGQIKAKEDRAYFSTKRDGQASGYGDAIVKVRIPLENLKLEDVFDGEAHVTMSMMDKLPKRIDAESITKQDFALPEQKTAPVVPEPKDYSLATVTKAIADGFPNLDPEMPEKLAMAFVSTHTMLAKRKGISLNEWLKQTMPQFEVGGKVSGDALLQRGGKAADTKDLIVAHNLTSGNLLHADRLGGIALPSIAITKKGIPFEGFGEITLLANKDLIDPNRPGNRVVDADMYSPRYPAEQYVVNMKKLQPVFDDVYAGEKPTEIYNLAEAIKSRGTDAIDVSNNFAKRFLSEAGHKVPKGRGAAEYARTAFGDEFHVYAQRVVDSVTDGSRIFKGFTPMGMRRYQPYTLDNIVRIMKSQMKEGEGFNYGVGTVRAAAYRKFRNISAIEKNRSRIVTSEEMDKVKNAFNDRLIQLAEENNKFYTYGRSESISIIDQFTLALADGSKKNRVVGELKEYGFDTSKMNMKPVYDFLNDLRNAPTEYFEAKPQRAVSLGAFSAGVVPKGTGKATLDALRKYGIEVFEYDKSVKGDRQRAIDAATQKNPDLLFQQAAGRTKKGAFEAGAGVDGHNLIRAFQSHDLSTAIHEPAHHFLDLSLKHDLLTPIEKKVLYNSALRDIERVFGKDSAEYRNAVVAAHDRLASREIHEYFARATERMVREGKVDHPQLKTVFAKFQEWLRGIYKRVKNSSLDVKVSREMRALIEMSYGVDKSDYFAKLERSYAEGADRFAKSNEVRSAARAKTVWDYVPAGTIKTQYYDSQAGKNRWLAGGAELFGGTRGTKYAGRVSKMAGTPITDLTTDVLRGGEAYPYDPNADESRQVSHDDIVNDMVSVAASGKHDKGSQFIGFGRSQFAEPEITPQVIADAISDKLRDAKSAGVDVSALQKELDGTDIHTVDESVLHDLYNRASELTAKPSGEVDQTGESYQEEPPFQTAEESSLSDFYHGTHSETAEKIKKTGFIASEDGTAGQGVYIGFSPAGVLYARNPRLSASVREMGRQPDVALPVKLNGKLYDVGKENAKEAEGRQTWSLYLRPQIAAALNLNPGISMNDVFANAPELIRAKGYVGVKWSFLDGRRAAVVFDPKDISVGSGVESQENVDMFPGGREVPSGKIAKEAPDRAERIAAINGRIERLNAALKVAKVSLQSGLLPKVKTVETEARVKELNKRLMQERMALERTKTDLFEGTAKLEEGQGDIFSNPQAGAVAIPDISKTMRSSLEAAPKLTKAGAGDTAVEHAAAKIAVPHMVSDFLSQVFPKTYKNLASMSRTMDVINKDNILGGYDQYVSMAQEARAEGQIKQAQHYEELASNIAEAHDLPQLETDVRTAMQDPEIMANVERWKKVVNPFLDQLFNEMKGVDPNTPRSARGRLLGARVNLLTNSRATELLASLGDANKPLPEAPASNYRNPNAKRDRFDRQARLTGDYSTNPGLVLANVIGPRWNEVTKLRFFADLEKSGAGKLIDPASRETPPETIQGKPAARMVVKIPVTIDGRTRMEDRSLYVRSDLVREVRDVLATDMPLPQFPGSRLLTNIQLLQISDAVTHIKNLLSVVERAQGAGKAWVDMVRKFEHLIPGLGTLDSVARVMSVVKEVASDSPEIRAEKAQMAKLGLIRPDYPPRGIQKITHMQRVIHDVDTASRILMNRFYDQLVERKLVTDDPANRRRYINQVGQYNRRLMKPLVRVFRDLGLSPFIVAGQTMNRSGRMALTGAAGIDAANPRAALQMRGTNLIATICIASITPMMLNMITTGTPTGRPGTPLGAWDLGTEEDEKSKHKIIDLLALTGARRGMRSLGINATVEGLRAGHNWNQIAGDAAIEMGQSALHPWMGPAPAFLFKSVTGRQPDLRGKMEAQRIPEGGVKQFAENSRAALESQNPLVYSVVHPVFRASGIDKTEAEPWGPNIAETLLKSPYGAAGVKDVYPTRTAAETMIATMLGSSNGLTPEQGQRLTARDIIRQNIKRGANANSPVIKSAMSDASLGRKDIVRLERENRQGYLVTKAKQLTIPDLQKVIGVATPLEKTVLNPILKLKLIDQARSNMYPVSKISASGHHNTPHVHFKSARP
jgi:hypothetical protein